MASRLSAEDAKRFVDKKGRLGVVGVLAERELSVVSQCAHQLPHFPRTSNSRCKQGIPKGSDYTRYYYRPRYHCLRTSASNPSSEIREHGRAARQCSLEYEGQKVVQDRPLFASLDHPQTWRRNNARRTRGHNQEGAKKLRPEDARAFFWSKLSQYQVTRQRLRKGAQYILRGLGTRKDQTDAGRLTKEE